MFDLISNLFRKKKKEKKEKKAPSNSWTNSAGLYTRPDDYVVVPPVYNPYSDMNPVTNPAPAYETPSPVVERNEDYPSRGTREHEGFYTGGGFGGESPRDHDFSSSSSSSDSSSSYSSDYSSSSSDSSYSSSSDSSSSYSGGD